MALTPPDPFEGVNWEETHKRLLVAAVRLFALHRLGGRDSVVVGVGSSPADLVQEVITKTLTGDGICYEAAKGQILPFLKQVMMNDFLDMRRARSHQTTNRVNHSLDDDDGQKNGQTLDGFPARTGSCEDSKIFFLDAKKAVESEPKLVEYVEAMEMGCEKPADVAAVCLTDIADIYQRRRKLEKRLARMTS